jgi:hypothetical protein
VNRSSLSQSPRVAEFVARVESLLAQQKRGAHA